MQTWKLKKKPISKSKTPWIRRIVGILMLVLTLVFVAYDFPQFWNQAVHAVSLDGMKMKENPFKLGLDLQGGTHLVYEADMSQIEESERTNALEGVKNVIERRVNAFGVSEPVVQTLTTNGTYRLVIELAGVKDVTQAIDQIGKTPVLEFKEPAKESVQESEGDTAAIDIWKNTALSGKQLKRAAVQFDPNTNNPNVLLEFNDEGAKFFEELTKAHVGEPIAIFLDGKLISAPRVQQAISGGQAVITGTFSVEEARLLAQDLNAGALPVPINLLSQQTIGPTLGSISLSKSINAGLIGLLLVALFMLVFYRLPGVIAVLALLFFAVINLAAYRFFDVTITLAGIAGFVLSIGMAVDANVLIFERLKEELHAGRDFASATDEAFARAWTSIRDGNLTTLIAAAVLYWFSSSFIRGFALTLAIGVLLSMLSAITVSRIYLKNILAWKWTRKNWLFCVKK